MVDEDKYELLKLKSNVESLENELVSLFNDFKKTKSEQENSISKNPLYQKQDKLNITCINLIKAYREYTAKLRKMSRL